MDVERLLAATVDEITPVLVVDEEAVEANLGVMATRAREAGVRLRPHAKTHKSPRLALRQLAHGAAGLTVATLREAEVFAAAGVEDILLAHPPAGAPKLARLGRLAERVRRLAVGLDDLELATELPLGVEVLWEVDCGLHRLGTPPGRPTAEAVLRLAEAVGPERVRGLMTHAGQAYAAADRAARERAAQEEMEALRVSAELLGASGLQVRELSVGSTPTAAYVHAGVTEMRPGTYVYGDANQVTLGSQALEACALAVVATVVSLPAADRVVVDAGSKALSADLRVPGLEAYGIVLGHPDLRLVRLSEEHGVLVGERPSGLSVGARLAIVPAHACTTVNLHPGALSVGAQGARWDPVAARGWRPPAATDWRAPLAAG